MDFSSYGQAYENVRMTRDENGILEVVLHSDGGPLSWGAKAHSEIPRAFHDIGDDRENRVVILTGAGDAFCADRGDGTLAAARHSPEAWDRIYWEAKKLFENLLAIEVPVIAAVNGPARWHTELAVLSDIVLAADTALFQDRPHFPAGVVPGDGVQLAWLVLLGPNRGRHFLLTGRELSAQEALALGVVAEVLPPDELMPRARAIATEFATRSTLTLRYTRVALVQHIRRMILEDQGYALSLEGMAWLRPPKEPE